MSDEIGPREELELNNRAAGEQAPQPTRPGGNGQSAPAAQEPVVVVDDGPCRYGRSVTVVRVEGNRWEVVQEGIDDLNKAIELRKDYDDAMAYLNLLFREKADLECGDPDARKQDLATADDWVKKTMETKKAKAEKQQGPGGIVLDQPGANK